MKTLNELYEEIIASDELKKEFAKAVKQPEALAAFAKANGVEATMDEIAAYIKAKTEKLGKLNDEELDMVSGGGCGEITFDVIGSALVVGCLYQVAVSIDMKDSEWGKNDAICSY